MLNAPAVTDAVYGASVIFRHAGHLVGFLMTRPEVTQPPLQAMMKGAGGEPLCCVSISKILCVEEFEI